MSRSGSSGGILGASPSPAPLRTSACASSFFSSIASPLDNCDRYLFSLWRGRGAFADGDDEKAVLVQGLNCLLIGSLRKKEAALEFIVVDLGLMVGAPFPLTLIFPGSPDCHNPHIC